MMMKIASVQLSAFEADCPADFKRAILQCFEAKPTDRPDPLSFIETVETVKFEMQQSSLLQRYVYYWYAIRLNLNSQQGEATTPALTQKLTEAKNENTSLKKQLAGREVELQM